VLQSRQAVVKYGIGYMQIAVLKLSPTQLVVEQFLLDSVALRNLAELRL
jgi:hypothetical protein